MTSSWSAYEDYTAQPIKSSQSRVMHICQRISRFPKPQSAFHIFYRKEHCSRGGQLNHETFLVGSFSFQCIPKHISRLFILIHASNGVFWFCLHWIRYGFINPIPYISIKHILYLPSRSSGRIMKWVGFFSVRGQRRIGNGVYELYCLIWWLCRRQSVILTYVELPLITTWWQPSWIRNSTLGNLLDFVPRH